jgi:subtilisin family serine protease
MKKSLLVLFSGFLVCCIVFIIRSNSKATQTLQTGDKPQEYVPNEILVKFKEYAVGDILQNKRLIQNIVSSVQGKIKTYLKQEISALAWEPLTKTHRSFIGDPYLFHIKIPEEINIDYAIRFLKMNPYVEYAEKNGLVHLDTIPNDDRFDEQWALYNPPSRKDIHAPEAWNIFTGSSEVVVAVLDSGIDLNHPDLAANIWTNPNDPADGVDNDQNGFVDDLHGWDFINSDNEPQDDNSTDNVYHGTSVSGIIGAVGNNDEGISGVCWNVKLMPVKVGNMEGWIDIAAAINGIDYAISNGAFLLNASWHSWGEYQSLKYAIARALFKNRLFVCSAGNARYGLPNGWNIDDPNKERSYPSNWTLDNILSVLATELGGGNEYRDSSSLYGPISVDIGAPGWNILTTKGGEYPYLPFGGTSAATPHVAGVAALALGVCPGLTSNRLKNFIINGADYVSDLNNKCVSEGRLNAYNVLNAMGGSTAPNTPSNLDAYPRAWNIIQLRWNDNSNNELGFEIQRKDQYQTAFIHENCADSNSTSMVYFEDNVDATKQRTYTYRVRAVNRAGISAFSNTVSASIPYTAPEAPTDLYGQSPTFYPLVDIYWANHAANALYNFLERRIAGYGPWEVIATLSFNADVYTDLNALPGHTYEYRIRAWNPLGYSDYSNVIAIEVIVW